jgi:extracellular matrix protein 14
MEVDGDDDDDDDEEEVQQLKKKKKKKKKKNKKSHRPPLRDSEKLGFVIIGAQHAREWVATSTAIYLAHSLLVNQTAPNSLHKLLDHFDFHFVPVPNPDGYAYTWQTDRYWYKNRQVVGPYTRCIGLDMNRNWGYKWHSKVADFSSLSLNTSFLPVLPTDPCSHWYPGSRAFESPEVNSIANWITTLPNLAAFIDLRSYGQMISSPFSYSCNATPRDLEDQTEAALGSSQALTSAHGTPYKVGRLCETLYPAPGNVLDWMYAREAVKYGYVVHLRDTGTYGFTLPERWIRPTGEETNRMVNYLSRFIARQADRHF